MRPMSQKVNNNFQVQKKLKDIGSEKKAWEER